MARRSLELEGVTILANRYRIIRRLGRGGMGEVFAAENIRTGRPVAVKFLRTDSKSKSSSVSVARFEREARATGRIKSDHVTQVLTVEEDPEHGIFLVFELLEGESLIDRLKRTGPIPFEELHAIVEQIWMGLADAHREGIIHRDLKPSNVFLERRPDGATRVKILDFGISKVPKDMGGDTLTEVGQSLGTFSFMPPEQINKAKNVDHRADIYACTTLIYQALTGQLPYPARNILAMVEQKNKTEPRKLSEVMDGAFDPRLEVLLDKGLARDPAQRFQTAIEALNAWRELRPGSPRSPSRASLSHAAVPNPIPLSSTASDMAATLQRPPPLEREAVLQTVREPLVADAQPRYRGGYEPIAQPGLGLGPHRPHGTERFDHPLPGVHATAQTHVPYLSSSAHQLPRVYDESSTGPPSQEKTQIYRPLGGAANSAPPLEPMGPMLMPVAPERGAPRWLVYSIAVVICALLGFVIVALVLWLSPLR